MDRLSDTKMLKFRPNTLEDVRKIYGWEKPGELKKAVDQLQDWVVKQNHFVEKEFSREYLERMLMSAKGSVERTKSNLDKICTLRTLLPSYFQVFNIKKDFSHFFDKLQYVVLPKLTKDHDRIFLGMQCGNKFTSKALTDNYKFSIMLMEYTRAEDYPQGYHIILDYRNTDMTNIMANCNIMDLQQPITLVIQGYGVRVQGIHLIITSKLVDAAIAIAKQVVSEKIAKRIHVHKDLESLYKHIPKEVMPADYGGEDKPLSEIHADWVDTLSTDEFSKYWQKMCKARTDESLRQANKFTEQYMGMPGSFRTLSVD